MNKRIKINVTKLVYYYFRAEYDLETYFYSNPQSEFLKILQLPDHCSRKISKKNLNYIIKINVKNNIRISNNASGHLHQWVMVQMCKYCQIKEEIGGKVIDAILTWMINHKLDDDVLNIETAKKSYYRYKTKLKKDKNNTIILRTESAIFVPRLFYQNYKAFLSIMKGFEPIKKAYLKYFDIKNVLSDDKDQYTANRFYRKTIMIWLMKYVLKWKSLDIEVYLKTSYHSVNKIDLILARKIDQYINDFYEIFKIVMQDQDPLLLKMIEDLKYE